jgi:hypothetical protein
MRRPIAATRRKLLSEALDAKGGAKFIAAQCLFEQNALTFVVQAKAAGLAKRLKAALLMQTDLRLKVRVRGEEPDDWTRMTRTAPGPGRPRSQEGNDQRATQHRPGSVGSAYTQRLQS